MRITETGAVVSLWLIVASLAGAAPPGPIDGRNIPSNFGSARLMATQTNYTQYGDYQVMPGAYLPGSETDELFLARDADYLYVGITGNLETVGHAWMIGIDIPNRTGQIENRVEGQSTLPFTLEHGGREWVIRDNDTPDDLTDDYFEYVSDGMFFPCETDYVLAVDTWGGTAWATEYLLLDPNGPPVGYVDLTPENGNDPDLPLFAEKTQVIEGPTNDGNDLWDWSTQGYSAGGFDNRNVDGVTHVDGSSAATAGRGLEVAIPFERLGLPADTDVLGIYVLLMDGYGGPAHGTVVNQVLPSVNAPAVCDPPEVIGLRVDLRPLMDYVSVAVGDLPAFNGVAEGLIDRAEYGGAAFATQQCPTPYGDQSYDPEGLTRAPGSELDALYVSDDGAYLHVGITGNLEENQNRLNLWIDSVSGGVDAVGWDPMAGDEAGMEGDILPPLASDPGVRPLYDYVLSVNAWDAEYWVDIWDLQGEMSVYRGRGIRESGTGLLDPTYGSNRWGLELALDNRNSAGVVGCQPGANPCGPDDPAGWDDDAATVAAYASTATSGFEFVIPLPDLGLHPCSGPAEINLWVHISSRSGWRSNQSLPPAREPTCGQTRNADNRTTDWYSPEPPCGEPAADYYRATAATHVVMPAIANDCNGNGVEDLCDVLDETSPDCNENAIPDECEKLTIDEVWSVADHVGAGPCYVQLFSAVPHSRLRAVDPRLAGVDELFLETNVELDPATVTAGNVQLTCDGAPHPGAVTVGLHQAGGCGFNGLSLQFSELLPDGGCCVLTLNGMLTSHGQPFAGELIITPLVGDVDGTGSVLGSDMLAIKPYVGQAASDTNARYDLDGNGQVLGSDMLVVKPYIGHASLACP